MLNMAVGDNVEASGNTQLGSLVIARLATWQVGHRVFTPDNIWILHIASIKPPVTKKITQVNLELVPKRGVGPPIPNLSAAA